MKELLITSTVLIAVILLLRLILRKWVSKRLIYAAWLLVVLRLLIPVQFGQFQYSLVSVAERLEQQAPLIQQAQKDLGKPLSGVDREELYRQFMQDYLAQAEAAGDPSDKVPPAVQIELWEKAEAVTVTFAQLLTVLWACGAVLMAGWFLITNLLFLLRARKDAVAFDHCSSPIPVRISPGVSTPCLAGLFRPRIYLTPESTEDPQALNHILTHELTHWKHLDHIWVWVRCLCLCLYWFHPLVWLAAILSKRDCELACDEAALKKLGEDQRIAYARTLLETVTHSSVRIFHTTTAMSESGKQLKERVKLIVKKPKNILIAAVCFALMAALATGWVFTDCKYQVQIIDMSAFQETTPPTQTEPTVTEPPVIQTEPTVILPDILTITPVIQTDGPTEAQLIAMDAINRYLQYRVEGICCDYEYLYADLSKYLTDAQKEEYYSQQYKITCCQNAKQVRAHIDRCIGKAHQEFGYPDSKLFTDGDGNLYVTVTPMCYNGYRHCEVISQTDEQIVARACSFDEDGCYRNEIFTLNATKSGYRIRKIEEDRDYRCEAITVAQGSNYKVLKYGSSYGYELYDSTGELKVSNGTDFHCPTVTPISEHIMEIAIHYGPGITQRTYRDMQTLNESDSYDYAIAVGNGKIAYLEGELEHRTLVVCDIFDRSTARTFTDLGFAPDVMPVSEAAFSSDGTHLTLTYYTGKDTETAVTLEVAP